MIQRLIPRWLGHHRVCQAIVLTIFLFGATVQADLVRAKFERLALGSRFNLFFEIGGTSQSPLQHDQYVITEQFVANGNLTISLTDESGGLLGTIYEPQAGDAIQLFVLPVNTTGSFNAFVLPDISAQNLAWDTQYLTDPKSVFAGQLHVVAAVPEASPVICFACLGLLLAGYRRWHGSGANSCLG